MLAGAMLAAGLVLNLAAVAAEPVPGTAWDLRTLYRTAITRDPAYLAASQRAEADGQALPLARSALLPQVNASANRQHLEESLTTNPGGTTETVATNESQADSYSLTVDQTLFDARAFAGLSQAGAIRRRADAQLLAARQGLILRVTRIYFDFLRSREELALTQAEQAALKEQAALARARLEVGMAAVTETYEAEARLALVDARVIERQVALDRARDDLHILSGETIDDVIPLRDDFVIPNPEPDNMNNWIEQAMQHNAALLAGEAGTDAARQEISRQRAGHYPRLSVSGERYRRKADGSLALPDTETDYEATEYNLELKLPLFQGGSTLIQTREARLRYEAEQQQQEQLKRELVRDTREAFQSVASGKRKLDALAQSVKAHNSVIDAKLAGFRAGINTNQHVLDAQRDLFAARRDYANARYDVIQALLKLKQLAGSLNDNDLYEIGDAIR
ncbi:MAG: TolC family outer membrane protein [Gammaproteobacteria bacterium]|nr:TolC family outer membrane protein [Gammaproteobacteria bacterium]